MKGRRLSPSENDIWRRVTRDITPIAGDAATVTREKHSATGLARQKPDSMVARGRPAAARQNPPQPKKSSGAGASATPARTPALHQSGDPTLDRRAARGRLSIDGTLDLHGHRQSTAHRVLAQFVARHAARRSRCLLVITGKGAPSAGRGGVLRQRLLDWVEEPAIRTVVSRVAQAHQRHGGDGAFYVFLKAPRRKP